MKKPIMVMILLMIFLCMTACGKVMPIEKAQNMTAEELSRKLDYVCSSDIYDVWGEPYGYPENSIIDLFEAGDEIIAVSYDPKDRVSDIRKLFWCEGRYVRGKSSNIVLLEQNGYIEAAAVSGEQSSFESFENGDRIRILVESIAESYPCQAKAYKAELIGKGSYDDLDKEQMDSLRELGWVE